MLIHLYRTIKKFIKIIFILLKVSLILISKFIFILGIFGVFLIAFTLELTPNLSSCSNLLETKNIMLTSYESEQKLNNYYNCFRSEANEEKSQLLAEKILFFKDNFNSYDLEQINKEILKIERQALKIEADLRNQAITYAVVVLFFVYLSLNVIIIIALLVIDKFSR